MLLKYSSLKFSSMRVSWQVKCQSIGSFLWCLVFSEFIELYLDYQYSTSVSNKNLALHWREKACPGTMFPVKCCKLHLVFKILSKSHMLDIFQFQVCTTNVHINYDFILSKSLNSPDLYIYISWLSKEKTQFVLAH